MAQNRDELMDAREQLDQEFETRLRYKRITDYTAPELDYAVNYGANNFRNFFKLLRAIDAYFERRRRKDAAQ